MNAVRRLAGRVKRWRGGQMILRWVVTADAAGRFRRIAGAHDAWRSSESTWLPRAP